MKRLLFILIVLAPALANAQALQRWERIKPISAQVQISNPTGADMLLIQKAADGLRYSIRLDSLLNLVVTHPEATLTTDDATVLSLNESTQELNFNKANLYSGLTSGYVPYLNGGFLDDSPIYTDGTKVSIGGSLLNESFGIYKSDRPYIQWASALTGTTINDGFIIGLGSADGMVQIRNKEKHNIEVLTNNTRRFIFYADGNIGINTSTDNGVDKLQVNGTASGSDAYQDGQFVTYGQDADFLSLAIDGTDINDIISDSVGSVDLSAYWKSDGTSTATGNFNLGAYTITAGGATINGTLSATAGTRDFSVSSGGIFAETDAGVSNRILYYNSSTNEIFDGAAIWLRDASTIYPYDGTSTRSVTASNFILASDKRLKKDITNLRNLEWADNINFKQFRLKASDTHQRYGVIAQELEQINPELVRKDTAGIYSVAYIDLLVAKAARHDQQIAELQKQVKYLSYERIVIIIVCIALFFVAFIRTSSRHA